MRRPPPRLQSEPSARKENDHGEREEPQLSMLQLQERLVCVYGGSDGRMQMRAGLRM